MTKEQRWVVRSALVNSSGGPDNLLSGLAGSSVIWKELNFRALARRTSRLLRTRTTSCPCHPAATVAPESTAEGKSGHTS